MLPKTPVVLLSMVNTYLRDRYASLDALCDDLDESKEEIESILASIDYKYDVNTNQFK